MSFQACRQVSFLFSEQKQISLVFKLRMGPQVAIHFDYMSVDLDRQVLVHGFSTFGTNVYNPYNVPRGLTQWSRVRDPIDVASILRGLHALLKLYTL
jgi:hypothetical protein